MFCYQQNFFSPTREVNGEQFWALVKAPYTAECINKFRETGDAAYKKRLPAFIFQATFDETVSKKGYTGRWRKQAATRLTGLVVMDVDHVESPALMFKQWQREGDRHIDLAAEGVLLVYVTPSGHGLKVVFKARAEWGNLIDNQHRMAEVLGVEVDEACKDASRLSFICRGDDILYIDTQIFTYYDKEYDEKFTAEYRLGNSKPTGRAAHHPDDAHSADGGSDSKLSLPPAAPTAAGDVPADQYRGVAYSDIIDAWLGGSEPQKGDRHNTLLKLASDLRYICDNKPALIKQVLMQQPWVATLAAEGEDIDRVISSALDYKLYATMPQRLQKVLLRAGVKPGTAGTAPAAGADLPLPLAEWGSRLGALAAHYPCMAEASLGLPPEGRPAALYVASALLGTLMTRCTYRFYHRPEELRRLNYCVMVIGDPASGKSFATRLYKLLADPIRVADRVGYDAINRYKRERQERGTSSKAQKGEALKKPQVIIRDHPARTSNATFIEDMNNAVETVDGQPMHLHLLTFDSELDNATLTQRGGSWIDKSSLELKAYHNEEDGQAYSNVDSVSGTFRVYWNYIYTGTPLSLQRKVTERNFGSGLATRLGVVPLPPSNYRMMPLVQQSPVDQAANETLKTWAYRLDGVRGELPLWPLVKECWQWTADQMEIAAFDRDRARELLLKRVAYYGICVTAPWLMMRHYDEWQEHHTLAIDDTDLELLRLVLDIQFQCQRHFFGAYAEAYFDNMERDNAEHRQRRSRYDDCYRQLPREFSYADLERVYGVSHERALGAVKRLKKAGLIVKNNSNDRYTKLKDAIT